MSLRSVTALLIALALSGLGCAQRNEIIAIASDGGGGGEGGAGGQGGAGGAPVLVTTTLEEPSCAGTLDDLAAGPVDAVGGDDLVVGGDGCLALYPSDGDTFGSPQTVGMATGAALALGRLQTTVPRTSTEPLDLVVADAAVEVLLGDGDGTFAAGSSLSLGVPVAPGGLGLVDLGGDAALDLATVEGDSLVVRFGLGDGSFGAAHPFAAPTGARVAVFGHLDDDSSMDAVVAGAGVAALLGDGMGGFHAAQALEGGDHVGAVALGDLNDDGCLDVAGVEGHALGPGAGDARLRLWLGDCAGHLSPHDSVEVAAPTGVVIGDLGSDGHLDVVVTHSHGVTIWSLDGEGVPFAEQALGLDGEPRGARMFDVDDDGRSDLVVVAGDRVVVVRHL